MPTPFLSPRGRRAARSLALIAGGTAVIAGCDRIKATLYPPKTDAVWLADSAFVEQSPRLLLRAVRTPAGARAVPIASIGTGGVRALSLGDRGWRFLDTRLLRAGQSFVPYRGSAPLSPLRSARGMWEGGALDSLPGCRDPLPAAAIALPDGVELLTSGREALPTIPATLGAGVLQEVLYTSAALMAPMAGITLDRIATYRRSVAVVGTGATASPTIVVSYEDPQVMRDSSTQMAERPRQLIVVFDRGSYGYRPSLTLSDVSATRISPRRRFLGALDTDRDGKAELFFGLSAGIARGELVTYSYRFSGDTWVADWEYTRARCR